MLIRFGDGAKFSVEKCEQHRGLMRNRQREILDITFSVPENKFEKLEAAIGNRETLGKITLYYPENETENSTDEQLEGVAHTDYINYTLVGEVTKREYEISPETSTAPAEYGKQMFVQLGERLLSDD